MSHSTSDIIYPLYRIMVQEDKMSREQPSTKKKKKKKVTNTISKFSLLQQNYQALDSHQTENPPSGFTLSQQFHFSSQTKICLSLHPTFPFSFPLPQIIFSLLCYWSMQLFTPIGLMSLEFHCFPNSL